jgi:thiamine biosynthesis lipoprotein
MLLATVPLPLAAAWMGEELELMGTSVSVELWHDDAQRGRELVQEVLAEYRRIDAGMSTYKADSEISMINREAGTAAVTIGEEIFTLINRSLELSQLTSGAFDITYESVGYLYNFRARQRPSSTEIDAHLVAIDYQHVLMTPQRQTIAFARPGVRINLGGIAKGYAVARGAEILQGQGVEHALLNAGGDTRVLGDRRGQPWVVGIRHPRLDDQVVTRLPLVDEAISTSGDYERYFEDAGRRYHHIINPATGVPAEGILSVTVIGPDATLTDGLSTALFVLGLEAGLELIQTLAEYEAIIVDVSGKLSYSDGLVSPAP